MVSRTAVRRSVPVGELPAFTPVPRKLSRHDGWTPERQRAFIAALADTGCVSIAARMVNMSQASVYQLRRQPGATSFRAAMDAAQTLGLQPVKDEAFDRAMNGQLVPVFVAGRLMGFRRKKNDRLLMFILRHYGQDAQGRKTTINYFSTRASAGAGASSPSPLGGEGRGEGESGETHMAAAAPSAIALAKAEASTTTVKTVISGGPGNAPTQLADDDQAANVLNAFQGVELDAEARDQIYNTLAACAERRRALEGDPENDPERDFVDEAETDSYLGELESGIEGDWVEYRPAGEHRWEGLGEGGSAAEADRLLADMEERRAKMTPEEIAARRTAHAAMARDQHERQNRPLPTQFARQNPALPKPEPDQDPRLDWRNWKDGAYAPPDEMPPPSPFEREDSGEGDETETPIPISPRTGKALKRYRKRQPKPPFTAPAPSEGEAAYEARKAQAVAAVKAERSELAAAEAERRKRRKG